MFAAKKGGEGQDAECAREAMAIMRRVRARLVTEHPFFGDIALHLELKADPACRDMWTDGRTLGFNPLYATTIREEKLAGAQAHEVLHLAFGHHVRRKKREKRLWNRACDLAINSVLLKAGFSLPDGFLFDADFAGKSADEIYDILVARSMESRKEGRAASGRNEAPNGEQNQDGPAGRGKDGLGSSSLNNGDGEERSEDGQRVRQEGRGVVPVAGKASRGKSAQGKTGRFDGEVRDFPESETDGRGSGDNENKAQREADILFSRAVNRARHMGSLPAGIEREVERVAPAALDWRKILLRFLSTCADSDYTWTVPNRRYVFQDIYMPSRWEQRLEHVVVAVDTSGSVDRATLALFMGEVATVLEFFDTRLTVLFHDTKVQGVSSLARGDLPDLLVPVGGGGTDFRPIPKKISDEGIHPACLVWFTDLECNRFPEDPGYPVLWVTPERSGEKPPFGTVVFMRESRTQL